MKLARLGGMGWVLVASAVACLHAWGQMGGASSGAPQAAVLDAEHRPITAGGFVKSGPVVFEDIAARAGLTQWRHTMGTPEKTYILETMGSGVGLLDYDNDGWLDIYLVNGSTYDAIAGKTTPPHAALFHNNHDGTMIAGALGLPLRTMTTMAGRISTSRTMERTGCTTTITMARLPMLRRRRASRWATGRRARRGATSMAMAGWICLCRAIYISI
jgi:hypothetical protein